MKNIIKIFKYTLYLPIYYFGLVIPQSNNIWVFGAWFGNKYSDNSRYLFEHINNFKPNIIPVWLTRKKHVVKKVRLLGYRAYKINSFLGFWYSARASVSFCVTDNSDVNYININKTLKIQLWHGTPLKKIGYDDDITSNWNQYNNQKKINKIKNKIFPFTGITSWDYVISSSPSISLRFQSALALDEDQVLLTGFPRADMILNSNPPKLPFINTLRRKMKIDKLVLYAPTHRKEGRDNTDYYKDFEKELLEKILRKHNSMLLIIHHYYQPFNNNNFTKENNNSRIHFLNNDEIDINILLSNIDILITDYSSIYFDYLLLNRPIIFFPFDIKSYMKNDRGFYEDYDLATPGSKCYNWKELIEKIDSILSGKDDFVKERLEAQIKYNSFIDNNNCVRITNKVEKILDK